MKQSLFLMTLIFSIWTGAVVAQSRATVKGRADVEVKQNCFRGRPLPKCKSFWITEFGYSFRLDDQPNRSGTGQANFYFTGELGGMSNLNKRSALGATFLMGFDDDGSRFGLKPRYRRWLNRTTSIDLSPGILFAGSNNQFATRFPGFTGHVGLNFGDWVALTGQMEISRLETIGTDVAWYGGMKLGSYAGPISGLALLGILAVAVATSFD